MSSPAAPPPQPLFDANVLLGPLPRRPPGAPEDLAALVQTLDTYGLDRALVTHTVAKWHAPAVGNARLAEELAGAESAVRDRLTACWVVLPSAIGEVPPEEAQVAQLLASGARAARLCPTAHRLWLTPWEVGPLLGALAERHVPVLLDDDNLHWRNPRPYEFVEWACRIYPSLPFILVREPFANLRTLAPLLDHCPNLVIETSYYQMHGGIKLVAERWGPERLVFGTGVPIFDPGLPLTGLTYAGLSAPALAAVGGGTLQTLLDGCLL